MRQFAEKFRHINAILNAARTFVVERPPEYEEMSARGLVEAAVGAVRSVPLARERGLDVEIDVDPSLRVQVDPTLIQQAFQNVLKNAVEASEDARPIWLGVSAKRTKGRVEFVFADRGCGMSAENMKALFRPYRSKKKGGTGLGMPLVKKIVEIDHPGGEVRVASEVGEGTRITIELPVRQGR